MVPLLALWFLCLIASGMAHLSSHIDDIASRKSQPASPHPCLICQSLAQSARSDILTQVQASLQPVFTSTYFLYQAESKVIAPALAQESVYNRGPPAVPSLRRNSVFRP